MRNVKLYIYMRDVKLIVYMTIKVRSIETP